MMKDPKKDRNKNICLDSYWTAGVHFHCKNEDSIGKMAKTTKKIQITRLSQTLTTKVRKVATKMTTKMTCIQIFKKTSITVKMSLS